MKVNSINNTHSRLFFSKKSKSSSHAKDMVGIGVGPFNLSLAALLDPIKDINSIFFDKEPEFCWHKGLLFEDAELQVHYLKDLVSLVDPTNRFSFLNFLANKKRLYHFITANFSRVSRQEFNQYFQWACQQLANIHFSCVIEEVTLYGDLLQVQVSTPEQKLIVPTSSIVMGIGLTPYVPSFAKAYLGKTAFHATEFLRKNIDFTGKTVAVIGGGQTGAEIIKYLINQHSLSMGNLIWLSKRDNFLPIDESPFVNDLFTPAYSHYFYKQPEDKKTRWLIKQRLFSDGISPKTLEEIYRQLYRIRFLTKAPLVCSLIPNVELMNMQQQTNGWQLLIKHLTEEKSLSINADIVIFCTGYRYQIPKFLAPLQDKLLTNGNNQLVINNDFSLQWQGPENCKLYIQNGANHSHGIADPNLSLMAWRSATIINSLVKKNIYPVEGQGAFVDWQANSITKDQEPEPINHRANRLIST